MPTIDSARAFYPTSDAVHDFEHVLRVYRMAVQLAQITGADVEIVGAAALLHDAALQKPEDIDSADREHHHLTSADLAASVLRAEGWSLERIAAVQHCIRSHRFRDPTEPPQTLEAQVLFDADKLDAIGAIGVARAIAYAVQAGQPAFALPSMRFLQTGEFDPGEAHTAYHEYVFKLGKLKDRLYTQPARQIASERHQSMADFFANLAAELLGEA